jgi:hypothetical protein
MQIKWLADHRHFSTQKEKESEAPFFLAFFVARLLLL